MTEDERLVADDTILVEERPTSVLTVLTVRQLMWMRFKRNRPAIVSLAILLAMYVSAAIAPFIAPYGVRTTHNEYSAAPPTRVRFFDESGTFLLRPFVYGVDSDVDPYTFAKVYTTDKSQFYRLHSFLRW